MACPLSAVSDDSELSWSDTRSMDSESAGLHSPWIGSLSASSTSLASSSFSLGCMGQLSPVSNGTDGGATESSPSNTSSSSSASPSESLPAPAMACSVPSSSSNPSSWTSMDYMGCDEPGQDDQVAHCHHNDASWDQEHDQDDLLVPKPEPMEEDNFCLADIKEAPLLAEAAATPQGQSSSQQKLKRPRGRPRKNPIAPNLSGSKITKGRSKTGCITCRKRKKKCDEAKPRCQNCEKNAVVCEGYPEKQIWKSGRERAEEERLRSYSLPSITIQPLFQGLETTEDRIFWKHYNEHVSTVLTVEGEHKNAFKDMMVPIAVNHQGLMHSLLSLASKHIDWDTPYGMNILRNNPTTSLDALRERSRYHHHQARLKFCGDVNITKDEPDTGPAKDLLTPRYGQMLCFLLESMVEGTRSGEHRLHLSAYRDMIKASPPMDPAFASFISEFFQYYIFADELLHSIKPPTTRRSSVPQLALEDLPKILPTYPPRLLGVADGLLHQLHQITLIRNTIRSNMMTQVDPVVNYISLYRAAEIEEAVRDSVQSWPAGDNREQVGLLYKQMMWIYLFRTIYPPLPSSPAFLSSPATPLPTPQTSSAAARPSSSAVNTPPHSATTSCASSPKLVAIGGGGAMPKPSPLNRGGAGSRPASPPPGRQPAEHNPRITQAINEALDLLEGFKPSDPSQTLLLLPCFVIGTACFNKEQQSRVRTIVRTIRGYTGLRNTDRVMDVLEEVWRLIDAGRWLDVWDWPGVASRMDLDFLPA